MSVGIEEATLTKGDTSERVDAAQAHVERFRAPFSLRCGAFLIDYIIIIFILAFCTLWARLLGGGARLAGGTTETIGTILAIVVALLNIIVLPAWRGQTIGKWATGLRIVRADGGPVGFGRIILRHLVGYLLSFLTLGLGFLVAVFSRRGLTLHDLLAGTVVLREDARGRIL